jgi:hypothetical protein
MKSGYFAVLEKLGSPTSATLLPLFEATTVNDPLQKLLISPIKSLSRVAIMASYQAMNKKNKLETKFD